MWVWKAVLQGRQAARSSRPSAVAGQEGRRTPCAPAQACREAIWTGGNTCRVPGQTWSSTLTHTHTLTYTLTHVYIHIAALVRQLGTDTHTEKYKCGSRYVRLLNVHSRCISVGEYMTHKMLFVDYMYNQDYISRLYPAWYSHSNPHMLSTRHSWVYGDVNVKPLRFCLPTSVLHLVKTDSACVALESATFG